MLVPAECVCLGRIAETPGGKSPFNLSCSLIWGCERLISENPPRLCETHPIRSPVSRSIPLDLWSLRECTSDELCQILYHVILRVGSDVENLAVDRGWIAFEDFEDRPSCIFDVDEGLHCVPSLITGIFPFLKAPRTMPFTARSNLILGIDHRQLRISLQC